jgi:Protein of unknown function (DUF2958)
MTESRNSAILHRQPQVDPFQPAPLFQTRENPVTDDSLLSEFQRARLEANGRRQACVKGTAYEIDFEPVVRLDDQEEGRIWLLSEIDPDQPHKAWGLCLCDPNCPEPYYGSVDLIELAAIKQAGFLTVVPSFAAAGRLSHYFAQAQALYDLEL